MRVLVVDDEPLARDELIFMLRQCEGIEVVGQAASAPEALALFEQTTPDVVFTDLRMRGPDGIALAESLRARWPHVRVVVVSAHDEGALRAFEVHVSDYLLKPVRLQRLASTLRRLDEQRGLRRANRAPDVPASETQAVAIDEPATAAISRLAVKQGDAYVVLSVHDILYFEVRDLLVWAVTEHARHALDVSLTYLEEKLPADEFFRSHRGFLVQVKRIAAMEPSGNSTFDLVLDTPNRDRVPLARERARSLRRRIEFAG